MDLQKAEEIGRIYSETSCSYGSFGEIVKLLYGEVIRQREYIKFISQEKWDMEKELEYCVIELERTLGEKRNDEIRTR